MALGGGAGRIKRDTTARESALPRENEHGAPTRFDRGVCAPARKQARCSNAMLQGFPRSSAKASTVLQRDATG
eukprot:2843982-Alexandrium_andersonii.AAC.1